MSLKKTDYIRLENLANQLRQNLGVRAIDAISVHQMIRDKKIIASFQPMSVNLEGMGVRIASENGSRKLFMLVNTSSNYGRQRFTACHEMYHLLFQDDFSVSLDIKGQEQKEYEEECANFFARYLLLPKEGLTMLTPPEEVIKKDSISIATILKLEHNFRCSRSCLLLRLKSLKWISDSLYEKYKKDVIRSATEYGYDTSLYLPTKKKELVGDYNLKARALYDRGLISQARYFGLLRDMGIEFNKD